MERSRRPRDDMCIHMFLCPRKRRIWVRKMSEIIPILLTWATDIHIFSGAIHNVLFCVLLCIFFLKAGGGEINPYFHILSFSAYAHEDIIFQQIVENKDLLLRRRLNLN